VWKIGPARVDDECGSPAARQRRESVRRRAREVLLISDIAGQHDLPALVRSDQVFEAQRNGDAVLGGVGLDRGDGEGVDVGGRRLRRAGFGRDRDEPRAGPEIKRALALDQRRIVERVTRERLPAQANAQNGGGSPMAPNSSSVLRQIGTASSASLSVISGVSGGATRRVFKRTKSRLPFDGGSTGIAFTVREAYCSAWPNWPDQAQNTTSARIPRKQKRINANKCE
jgi:hypothetical protein